MSKKLFSMFTLLLALSMLLAACGGTPGTEETEEASGTTDGAEAAGGTEAAGCEPGTYKIAYQGPLTGDNAALGTNMINAIELAITQANEGGELPEGVTLEAARFDSQGNPDQAPPLAQQAVADEAILAMVGPAFSGETRRPVRFSRRGCRSCHRRRPTPTCPSRAGRTSSGPSRPTPPRVRWPRPS